MKRFFTMLLLLIWTLRATAQVSVSAALDSTAILIGDQVDITLYFTCEPGVEIQDMDIADLDTLKAIELLDISTLNQVSKSGSGTLFQQKITITSFEEGIYAIPQIRIPFNRNGKSGNVYSPVLHLTVNTLDVDESTELQPIKNIIEERLNFRDALPFLLILAAVILFGSLVWLLFKRYRKKEAFEELEKKKLPAHIIALKRLAKLEEAQLWQTGQIKPFQSQLTFIFREYLENRFDIHALESTTDEIIADLKNADIDEEKIRSLKTILETADLVKFAKSEPPIEVHDQAFKNIIAFVNSTVPKPKEEEDITENKISTDTGDSTND